MTALLACLFVDSPKDNPAEFASAFRQRLRAMTDIELVYTQEEADLIVDILSFENHNIGGNSIGYTASVVVSDPCQSYLNSSPSEFRMHRDHFLQTSADIPSLVEGTVTTLDASDVESLRKENAMMRRILEGTKTKPQ